MTFARLRRRKAEVPDLSALLNSADPGASRPLRHLWLIDFLDWLRRPAQTQDADSLARERGTPLAVMRLRQALGAIERNPTYAQRIGRSLVAFIDEMDWVSLLADYGFSPQPHFVGELAARVRLRMLPATPDTNELAELFNLLFRHADDEVWLMALDDECLQALSRLIAAARGERLAPDSDAYVKDSNWREPFFEALQILCSHIRASGMSQALRRRIAAESVVRAPFRQLAGAAEAVYDAARGLDEAPLIDPLVAQKALYLRSLFDACRRAADTVADHLEEHGISVNVVFQTDQLRERIRRAENLLNCVLSPEPARELTALLADLMRTQQQRRSLRALFSAHYSLLTRKVVERSADAGEHYITRSLRTYRAMLVKAAGGGAVLAATTLFKFFILRLQASAFWLGLAAGVNYAASFMLIYLLGWTVATKQPAMTAPALAAQLSRASDEDGVEAFVDEVAHLIRSQMAGIIGNMCAVAPGVAVLQGVSLGLTGRTLISEQEAHHVLATLTVWGPTLIFAALTGVLLFLSSLIGGWVENWFVLHRP